MLALCKKIVIFLLVAKLLENLGVGEKYGKFVRLMISLIVVLKLIAPIFSLADGQFDFEKMTGEIERRLMIDTEEKMPTQIIETVEGVKISESSIEVEKIKWEK